MWLRGRRFEHKRDRPVIGEIDLHVGLKDSGLSVQSALPNLLHEVEIEFAGLVRTRGGIEARAAAFAAIAIQSELRDYQKLSARIHRAEIHLTRGVGKYAQVDELVDKIVGVFPGILRGNSDESDNSATNAALDFCIYYDFRPANSLYQDAHLYSDYDSLFLEG